MINDTAIEITKIMKEAIPEKTIAQYFLSLGKEERTLTKIGQVKDIDSDHKNELFDGIFKDQNEIIVDIRLLEEKPSEKELEKMSEYWWALQLHFRKRVEPVFIITG
ncbi:hypothetical protein [Methanobrevibacter sp.]|uniref:hypothetical protein n=1 Tax=Methanobrevibacter sp. TaxID=66852 RepID=UPI00388E55A5